MKKNLKQISSFLVSICLVFSLLTPAFAETPVQINESATKSTNITVQQENQLTSNTIDIISFNDFHGALAEDVREGRDTGMVKLVAATREAISKNPNTLIVAGGDNYSGTAKSNLTYGAPVSTMMKAMGVVASSVGNHEFNWGTQLMDQWQKDADFTFVAANIIDKASGEIVTWAKPYIITEKGGLKVAFIGISHPDTATLTKREHVSGIEFTDIVQAAQKWVDYLNSGKAAEGKPDVIIALTHLDSFQNPDTNEITGNVVKLANEVKGLHGIISGHSHRNVSGYVNDVPIVQAGFNGRLLGKLSIELNDDRSIKQIVPTLDNISVRKNDLIIQEDIEKVLNKLDEELDPILNEVIGQASDVFTHDRSTSNITLLGNWVTQVMKKKTGVDIAIQNGGGLRRTLEKGDITMGDLYQIMPFDNYLVTFDLLGADIKKAIDHGILNPNVTDGQFSGVNVVYDKDLEFGNRILSITLPDGSPLKMDKYYSVVVNDFMFSGGDRYDFSNAKNVVETFIPVRDMMLEEIKTLKVITPQPVTSIKEKEEVPVVEVPENVVPETTVPEPSAPETTDPVTEEVIYIVKKNDTLSKIAKAYNTTYQEIAKLNNIKNPNLIFVGQKLVIPTTDKDVPKATEEQVYIVVKNDTLSKIAKAYNTTYQILAEYNNISNPNLIFVGQKILIPAQ